MNAKELRQEAKQNLQGKWQKAIIISIIYAAIIFVLTLLVDKVSSIFSIVEFLITPALTYGIAYSYYHLKKGDEVGYVDFLTIGFKNFGLSWKIAWEIIKKVWWCILLAIIPLVIMIALIGGAIFALMGSAGVSSKTYYSGYYQTPYSYTYDYSYDDLDSLYSRDAETQALANVLAGASVGAIVGAVICSIVYIALAIFLAIKLLLYVLAYYIAVIKEGIDPKDAVIESATLMKGNRGRYFCLMLSFFGWYFLVGFVSGLVGGFGAGIISTLVANIGTAIIAPYTAFATIAFYENLVKEKGIDNSNPQVVNAQDVPNIDQNNNQ